VNYLLGHGKGLLAFFQSLVQISKQAKIPGCKEPAKYPWILSIEESMGVVSHGIVESDTLLEMFSGSNEFSPEHQRLSYGEMSLQEKRRVLDTLG
jgi:hypothetical protein